VLEGIHTTIVDYRAVANDPDFHCFLYSLDVAHIGNFTKNETYALYINAYNAFAIKMVLDHSCKRGLFGRCLGRPINSILDAGFKISGQLHQRLSTVWMKPAGRIAGKMHALIDVENYLRGDGMPFWPPDQRFHACTVGASISDTNLRAEAYRAKSVDRQMTEQFRDLMGNRRKGFRLEKETNTIALSIIFKWFEDDFETAAGSVVDFVAPFIEPEDDRTYLLKNRASMRIMYLAYTWDMNGKVPCNCTSAAR
jgi:hypothetical protein